MRPAAEGSASIEPVGHGGDQWHLHLLNILQVVIDQFDDGERIIVFEGHLPISRCGSSSHRLIRLFQVKERNRAGAFACGRQEKVFASSSVQPTPAIPRTAIHQLAYIISGWYRAKRISIALFVSVVIIAIADTWIRNILTGIRF